MDTIAKLFLLFILPAGCVPAVLSAPMGPMAYWFLAGAFALAGLFSGRREAALFKAEEAGQARQELEEVGKKELPANWRAMFWAGEGWTSRLILEPVENGIWSDMWELTHDIGMEVATSIWEDSPEGQMEKRLEKVSENWYAIEEEIEEDRAEQAEWEATFESRVQARFRELMAQQLLKAEAAGEKWGPFGADHLRWVAMSATCPIRRKAALSAIHGGPSPLEFASVRGYTLA